MYIGIDIGGTKILVVGGDKDGAIVRQAKIETPATADQGVMEIIHLIEQVAEQDQIKSIFVAAPGPVDRAKGVLFPVPTPNVKWGPTDIVAQLKNHFKLPVGLEKDANAAALAEAVSGAGKGYETVLYMTISTGVGTGLITAHEIYHGAHDPEGGHMYIAAEGINEELEAAVSGPAMKRRFGLYGYEITDPKIWDEYSKDLAIGVRNMITTFSPDIVVIGGGAGTHFDQFEQFLVQHLAELTPIYPDPPIVEAKYPETAVALGTLILAARLNR